jgi:uroporphyrinogen-III synthase
VKSFVEQFAAQDGKGPLPLIATFGEGTTRKAIESGLEVSVKAPTPEATSMARALEIFIGEVNAGRVVEPVSVGEDRQAKQVEEFIRTHQVKEIRKNKAKKKPVATAAVK